MNISLKTLPSIVTTKQAAILFWLTLTVVFFLAFAPHVDVGPDFYQADKLKHAAAFWVLTALYRRAYGPAAFYWGAMLAVGIFIEVVQYALPYRDASIFDLLADAAGIWASRIFRYERIASR